MLKTYHLFFVIISIIFSVISRAEEPNTFLDFSLEELLQINVTSISLSDSISTLKADDIAKFSPRSTADIFRNIPGIRSESSGGEGNANIAVRGLPIAAGGAKFLQLQEDSLPVLQFGDIAFGNADTFLRADLNVDRIEIVRGGSASTSVSNAPGGIINMISKTGRQAQGNLTTRVGLDFDQMRTDFEYGAPFANKWTFHIGGYFRDGTGVRNPGYDATSGGQLKANISRDLDNGFVRFYFKHLDDRSIGYLPIPMKSNGDSIVGFDSLKGTTHSPYLLNLESLDRSGNLTRINVADGMHPISSSFGGEISLDLDNNYSISQKFRRTSISGNFVGLFPSEVNSAQVIANNIGGSGATLVYANGPHINDTINDPASLNNNGLAMRTLMLNTTLNDLGSFSNDFKITKKIDAFSFTAGLYTANQAIKMDWLWNTYLMEVKGKDATLLNVKDANGNLQTENGLISIGDPLGSSCCTRNYDGEYAIAAPYFSTKFIADKLTIDASFRHDAGKTRGSYSGSIQRINMDINNDGVISTPEKSVSLIDTAHPHPINYDWRYNSYSVGGDFMIDDEFAVCARVSRGGRANADRLLFGPNILESGKLRDETAVVDKVDQIESGIKYHGDNFNTYITAFYAKTEEHNYEATTNTFFNRQYDAKGIESEIHYGIENIDLMGSLTLTDAEIVKDPLSPEVVGNTPRRQPRSIFTLTSTYTMNQLILSANIIGVGKSFTQDNNDLTMRGYNQVNLFTSYRFTKVLLASININNAFNAVGLTEAEEGSTPTNKIIRARTINGRSSVLTLTYQF